MAEGLIPELAVAVVRDQLRDIQNAYRADMAASSSAGQVDAAAVTMATAVAVDRLLTQVAVLAVVAAALTEGGSDAE